MKKILLVGAVAASAILSAQLQDTSIADECFKKGNFRCAEEEYAKLASAQKVAKLKSRHYNSLGTSQKRLGKYDEAIRSFENGIKFTPDYVDSYVNLSGLYRQRGDNKKALQTVEKGMLIIFDSPELLLSRAQIYENQKSYDLAEKDFKTVTSLENPSRMAKTEYAIFKKNRGKLDDALKDYNQLITEAPESLLYNNRADVYLAMKKYKEASADIEKALKLDPKFGLTYVTKTKLLLATGKEKEACPNLDKALANGIDRFTVADLLKQCGR